MNSVLLIVLIIIGLVGLIIIWKYLKPYFLRYNTTIMLTGELGAGKTLTAVKLTKVLIKKARLKVWIYNKIKLPLHNAWMNHKIKKLNRKVKLSKINVEKAQEIIKTKYKLWNKKRRPQVYSNIPIHLTAKRWGTEKKKEWSCVLNAKQILLLQKIPEYSIVLIDELPQLVNQFNWDVELVQHNLNEYITFFRHYVSGHLILTAQAQNDVVVQIRRKCNQAIWCYNMKKHLFGLFYTQRMCDMMLTDNIQTFSTTFIEENTRLHFGLFPPKGTYDSRCYSIRYDNALEDPQRWQRWDKLKTSKIIKLEKYVSPLDDTTSKEQKERMRNEIERL